MDLRILGPPLVAERQTRGWAQIYSDRVSSWRNYVEKITSVLDGSRSAVLRASRLEPGVARWQGQGNGRRPMQQLPRVLCAPRLRIHGRGMAYGHADDDQSRRADSAGSACDDDAVPDQELPGKRKACGGGGPGAGQGFDESVAGAYARVAAARSAGGQGRIALVHGPDGQRARPRRSKERQSQGISPQDGSLWTARPRRRQGWQH